MKPLYAIADEINNLLMVGDDGELPPGVEEQLDALGKTLEDKVSACCCAVRNLEAEENALSEEAHRFALRAQHAKAGKERLKAYIKMNLEKLGLQKLDAGLFKVRIQVNGVPSVHFDGDVTKLPVDFQRVEYSVNARAIVDAWKDGQMLPEGATVLKGTHLRIS